MQEKVEINQVDNEGNTALIKAAKKRDIDAVKILLSISDIEVNVVNNVGETASSVAIQNKDFEIVSVLEQFQQIQAAPFHYLKRVSSQKELEKLNQLKNILSSFLQSTQCNEVFTKKSGKTIPRIYISCLPQYLNQRCNELNSLFTQSYFNGVTPVARINEKQELIIDYIELDELLDLTSKPSNIQPDPYELDLLIDLRKIIAEYAAFDPESLLGILGAEKADTFYNEHIEKAKEFYAKNPLLLKLGRKELREELKKLFPKDELMQHLLFYMIFNKELPGAAAKREDIWLFKLAVELKVFNQTIWGAIYFNNVKSIKLALKFGVEINQLLLEAADIGDHRLLQLLLLYGADINTRTRGAHYAQIFTPLILASSNRRQDCVKILLQDPDVDVNACTNIGTSALSSTSEPEIIKDLCQHPKIDKKIVHQALFQAMDYLFTEIAEAPLLTHNRTNKIIDINYKIIYAILSSYQRIDVHHTVYGISILKTAIKLAGFKLSYSEFFLSLTHQQVKNKNKAPLSKKVISGLNQHGFWSKSSTSPSSGSIKPLQGLLKLYLNFARELLIYDKVILDLSYMHLFDKMALQNQLNLLLQNYAFSTGKPVININEKEELIISHVSLDGLHQIAETPKFVPEDFDDLEIFDNYFPQPS